MISGPYSVILSDCPWQYSDRTPRGGAEKHYRTLPLKEIASFKVNGTLVGDLAAPDCALFLWATWPLLVEALYVIRRWGFDYKGCAFTWVKTTQAGKPAMGLGRMTRGNTEPCLFATRGKPKRVDAGVHQVVLDDTLAEEAVFAPRGPHSAKPPEVRDRIVRLLGDVPRLELFARDRAPGWHAFGNELPQIPDSEAR